MASQTTESKTCEVDGVPPGKNRKFVPWDPCMVYFSYVWLIVYQHINYIYISHRIHVWYKLYLHLVDLFINISTIYIYHRIHVWYKFYLHLVDFYQHINYIYPIGSMYGINFTYIWLIFFINISTIYIYPIGSMYGINFTYTWLIFINISTIYIP